MKINFCILISFVSIINSQRIYESDQVLQLIINAGYIGETHNVETEDGYILKLHRIIPKSPNGKSPILIMHGILATAADFLVTGQDVGLGYLLSDYGYDVWLGNWRGSKHSPNHKNFSSLSKNYWSFSWHEMGYYDLPSIIDYVLNETCSSNIHYIAHSQGTTSFLVLMSSRPEYNQKIMQAHLMAPPAFRKKIPKSLIVFFGLKFLDKHDEIRFLELRHLFRIGELVTTAVCRDIDLFVFKMCKKVIKAAFGGKTLNILEIDLNLIPKLLSYMSPRVSTMQLTHYFQNMMSNKFRRFDYKSENMKFYNSTTPPDYELKNIEAPIYLYHAAFDNFITKELSSSRSNHNNFYKFRKSLFITSKFTDQRTEINLRKQFIITGK
ncbi:hypothetical protein ACKWTF_000922 [Chironomus riparius]